MAMYDLISGIRPGRLFGWIEDCLVALASVNYTDLLFKFFNWIKDAKVIVGRIEGFFIVKKLHVSS